jgi:hypothetical protein
MTDRLHESSSKAKVFRVEIKQGESGLIFATSPDLRGLLVAERTMEDLMREIPLSIAAIVKAQGDDAQIIEAEDLAGERPTKSWVKLPSNPNSHREYA